MIPSALALPAIVLATVAIEPPRGLRRPATDRLIESCRRVLGEDQCALASDDTSAEWRASITLDGVRLVVILERSGAPPFEVARREIVFSEDDSVEQRFFAAGLIVAALTAQQSKPEPEPAPKDTGTGDSMTPSEQTSAPIGGAVDLGALAGRGLSASDVKLGPVARGLLLFDRVPIGVLASVHFARSFATPWVRWWGGSAGIAATITDASSPLSLEVRGEFLLEQAQAHATRQGTRDQVTTSWRAGGRFGPVLSYRFARWVVPWVGADLSVIRPELVVRVADETVGSEGAVRWAFSLGGRFYLGE